MTSAVPDLVSTIIPVYNRPALLVEAAASVLAQTYRPIEIIIVDGSTDDTSQVGMQLSMAHPDEVTYIRQLDTGIPLARNAGLQAARGEFIQFLDSDDLLMPDKFSRQVAGLRGDPGAGISYCYAREYTLGSAQRDIPARRTAHALRLMFPDILAGRLWPTPTPLFRRAVIDAIGLFLNVSIYEDWEYECRAAGIGVRLQHCREFLADKRDVHGQEGRTKGGVPESKLKDYARVHEQVLGYARQAGVGDLDLDRFSKRLFRVARQCAAAGLVAEARRCVELAAGASGRPAPIRVYKAASLVCGWQVLAACCQSASRGLASSRAAVSRVRSALPQPIRRPLGYAWRRGADRLRYVQGKNILRRYTAHHRQARRIFTREGNRSELAVSSLRDVGVRLVRPGASANLFTLPDAYPALVARVSGAVSTRLGRPADCRFVPCLPDGPVPERTEDVAAVRTGEVIAVQILRALDIDGVKELCVPIMKELERKVFGSYAIVDKVYMYRSPVSRRAPRASWLWHYDNHPREVLKVMIYLTDVTEDTAPFEYLRQASSSGPLYGSPIAPSYGHTRVDDQQVRRWLSRGYERHTVTGPAGTMIVFDDNVIHRGTLAHEAHRDVLVLQVRPSSFRAEPYISERWTGSFQHLDVNRDPRDVTPRAKG